MTNRSKITKFFSWSYFHTDFASEGNSCKLSLTMAGCKCAVMSGSMVCGILSGAVELLGLVLMFEIPYARFHFGWPTKAHDM